VGFQQLYYTSCEHGLGGYGGYQFNAITRGVSPSVLREVEERTIYEPPRWLAGPGPDELGAYPVAFSYGTSEATGAAITTHVVFTGTDYSGRPGNYFVHALVTTAPERDFGSLFPVELWGATWWRTSPIDGTELQELPGPPPRGMIDRPGAQAFLDARGSADVLPELLTAVGRAMTGDRPVLMVSDDATENAWWIAAVSYLLGEHLARQLTFTTYSHRPGYSPHHLIGTLPDAVPPDAHAGFQTFDFTAGRAQVGNVHPLAAILADTGVMASPGLWQQAAAFASGAEGGPDDWLPPVAVAAGLLGRRLSPLEADAITQWLPGAADRIPPELVDVALGVPLAQPDGTLADERLRDLLGLARQMASPARAEHLERLLADRAVAHIARGEPAMPVALRTPAADSARGTVAAILDSAAPTTALAALDWASASGIPVPDAELEHYGRTRLDPATPERLLGRMARSYPAVLRGLLGRLAGEPHDVIMAVLAGPAAARLTRDDLTGYPELAELWLIQSAARGGVKPLRAFDEIVDIRAAAHRSPLVDTALFRLLWPGGCPPDQLAELLGALTDGTAPDVLDWFAAQVSAVYARGATGNGWLGLARVLADHPILARLPEEEARSVQTTVRVGPLLQRAYADGPRGDAEVFTELFTQYAAADDETRRLLDRELPPLLARARPLGRALRGCPANLAAALGGWLWDALAPGRADTVLARKIFAARADPDLLAQPALGERLTAAFEQVQDWRRRDLATLAKAMADDPALAQAFREWREARRGGLARRFRPAPTVQGGGPDLCLRSISCSPWPPRCCTWPTWPAPCR
jgi:hypothetical protein